MNKNNKRKGFTLIELLVVIAIIAVLSVVVILSLNPAELLRQARDSNRVSDMATLKSAVSLYLADVASPILGTAGTCYTSLAAGTSLEVPASSTGILTSTGTCKYFFNTAGATFNIAGTRAIDGTGWLPVAFTNISSGAPLGSLPVDAVNATGTGTTAGTFYAYIATSTTFKLATKMESKKYSNTGSNDVESTDGGINAWMYEQGTNISTTGL